MANAVMPFQGYLTTLTKPLGYCSPPSSRQLGHMTTLFTSLFCWPTAVRTSLGNEGSLSGFYFIFSEFIVFFFLLS